MYPTYLNVFFKENTRKYFDAWIISLFGENALKEQNKPQECIDASIEFVPPKFDILSPTQSLVDRASEIRSSLNGHKEEGWIKNIKKK